MKTRILILLAAIFLFQAVAQREPKSYLLQKAFNVNVPLSSGLRQVLQLKFDGKNPKLEVKLGNKTRSFEFETFMIDAQPQGSILVDDFNFDGLTDIGIPTGIGYGGVNYFYDFYTFEHSSKTFKVMLNPNGDEWCNPQLETKSKTIFTNCKSGPKWYCANFRLYGSKLYLYQSGEMVILEGFPDDKNLSNLLWHVSTFDHNKNLLSSSYFDYETTKTAVRYVPQAKVFLYTAPRDTAISKNYIIKNDRIAILEVKETEAGQWLKVAYHSQKLGWIKRWIRLD
jgi:hypothetical protein